MIVINATESASVRVGKLLDISNQYARFSLSRKHGLGVFKLLDRGSSTLI
jgi:hypothetical protein